MFSTDLRCAFETHRFKKKKAELSKRVEKAVLLVIILNILSKQLVGHNSYG